jgi:Gluconate 2-dehydrogenase subunit 3
MPAQAKATRRALLRAGTLLSATALTPACIWTALQAGASGNAAALDALTKLCAIVIPAGDTPGAAETGVPAFVSLAATRGLAGTSADAAGLVLQELNRRAGSNWPTLPPDRAAELVAALDAEAYGRASAGDAALAAWRSIKALIVIGYYTSEVGATQELRYQFVPGRYEADIPFAAGDRALMNDWWGNVF